MMAYRYCELSTGESRQTMTNAFLDVNRGSVIRGRERRYVVLLALAVRGDPAKGASTNAGRASANLAISMTIGGAECLFRGSSRRHSTHNELAATSKPRTLRSLAVSLNCKLCGLRVDCGTYVFSSAKP